jgi:hypothetical protein
LDLGTGIFGVMRSQRGNRGRVACLHNVTREPQRVGLRSLLGLPSSAKPLLDLVSGRLIPVSEGLALPPYGVVWLRPVAPGR